MAFHHRKLLNESAAEDPEESLDKLCDLFCKSSRKPDAVCPSKCLDYCPPFCFTPSPETPVLIFTPPPATKHYSLPIFLTISLAILAATFFLFTCYTIYRLYSASRNSRRRRWPSRRRQTGEEEEDDDFGPDEFLDEDHGPAAVDHHVWYIRTVGLQPSVIGAITIVNYNKGDGLIEGTDCSVCLSEFEQDETLRLLPKCNHAFHLPCIDTWLSSHTNCPMCRAPVVSNNPLQEPVVQNPGPVEETQTRVELLNEPSHELTIEIDTDLVESESESRTARIGCNLDHGIIPTRRSVSFDSLSASIISSAIANNDFSDKSSDNNRSLSNMQTGTCSVKRSLSCSAKVFLSRHSSKNRNSVTPQ
ncbi:hypothetical protein ABFX02_02G057100 [Erythranthe guttata]